MHWRGLGDPDAVADPVGLPEAQHRGVGQLGAVVAAATGLVRGEPDVWVALVLEDGWSSTAAFALPGQPFSVLDVVRAGTDLR